MRNARLLRSLGIALLIASPVACSSAGPQEDARSSSDQAALGAAAWAGIGGSRVTQIAVATNTDSNPAVFALSGGSVVEYTPGGPNGQWAQTGLTGSQLQSIAIGHNADGRLELFAIGGDGALWHRWQINWSNGWGGWQSLGGTQLRQAVIANEADGREVAFVLGGDGHVYRIGQNGPNGGWGGYTYVGGGPFKALAAGPDGNGALELFGLDTASAALWVAGESGANGYLGDFASLGGWNLQQVVVGQNQDGRVEAYVRGGDGVLYHQWRTTSGGWSGWSTIGGSGLLELANTSEADGRIDVFAVGSGHVPYETQQNAPNAGWSGAWSSLDDGSRFNHLSAMRTPDGRIHLFGIVTDGTIRTTWEQSPNGAWSAPPPPPPPCSIGQPGTFYIDSFNTPSKDGYVNLGDLISFSLSAHDYGSGATLAGTLDGKPSTTLQFAGGGAATSGIVDPIPVYFVTSALEGTAHTITYASQSCGNVSASVTIHVATPTPPVPALKASSTYVNVDAPVTLTPSVPSWRPRDCRAEAFDIIGTDYTGKVVFHRENVSGPITVYPSDQTYYQAIARCANVPSVGTARSSKVNVQVYSPPPASNPWWCFTVTTPDTASQPGSCWAEAVQAADESTAQSIEENRNGGNGTVDSLGQCTSIPTNACPWPFPDE